MFGVVPSAMAATPIPPNNIDGLQYDSYIISEFETSYDCILYDSSIWSVYVTDELYESYYGYTYRLIYFTSLNGVSGGLYSDTIQIDSYNPNSDNNGWGDFNSPSLRTGNFDDGSHYYFRNVQMQNVVDSTNSLYFGSLDTASKQILHGDVFFYNPMSLEEVTVIQIQGVRQILPTLDGNLKTLVPFGVGCLTLLMAYLLLSKVLRKFLS